MNNACSKALSLFLAALITLGQAAPLFAGPQGGTVVAGSATIRQESPTKVGITQTSDRAAINWQSFNIGANEQVQFYQPSSSSVALNRVVGPDPSTILGRLTANGQVYLVNPNGILFGKGSQVDVAGLLATTHDIKNSDFMAGRNLFTIPGNPRASVINEGSIRIADTGIAALVAPSVANRGIIAARLSKVALASANGFTLDLYGDQLLSFLVNDEVAKTAYDVQGNQLTSFVENSGRIEAQGGHVLLTAKAAEGVVHSVINQSGVIEATTVGQDKGEIILQGGSHGEVKVSGTLDASAPNGGDGGFIETSGAKVSIDKETIITTTAPLGLSGRWLLDPTNFTIAANGDLPPADLAFYLNSNNVEIQTLLAGGENGNIYVNEAVSWGSMNKLTLLAHNNIYINAPITASGGGSMRLRADSDAYGGGTVVFGANGHVTMKGGALGIYYSPLSYTDVSTKSDISGNPYISKTTLSGGSAMIAYMLVNNINQLQQIEDNLRGNYALGNDIDASVTSIWNAGKGFAPIGFMGGANFEGRFNGDSHTISGLYINRPDRYFIGLFGYTTGAISNTKMIGGYFYGKDAVGSIAGENDGVISNVSSISATILGIEPNVGTGGLVGQNIGSISTSYASNNVSAGSSVGGLVGINNAGATISNSYATGRAEASDYDGGLAGYNAGSIINSYSSTRVVGAGHFGGLVGYSAGGTVSNSYWDMTTSTVNFSAGGTGLISNDLRNLSAFAPWNFTDVWAPGSISQGSYPTLRWVTATIAKRVNPPRTSPPSDTTETTSTSNLPNAPGGAPSQEVSATQFVNQLAADPNFSTKQLEFDGYSFTVNGVKVPGGNLLDWAVTYSVDYTVGEFEAGVKDAILKKMMPDLATAFKLVSSATDKLELAAKIGKAAANMLDAHMNLEAVGSVVHGFSSALLNSAGSGHDGNGKYVSFPGEPLVYTQAVKDGLMTMRQVDGLYRYYITPRGALFFYMSKCPPQKVDDFLGIGGHYTYSGVQHDQELASQLSSALSSN